jgi:hypothetical protein
MNKIEQVGMLAELHNEVCGLNHGVVERPPAIDWLVLPMGFCETENVHEQVHELTIPVCNECLDEFLKNESEWVLLYCLKCNESQWILRALSRLSWVNKTTKRLHRVVWLSGCPKCGTFDGIYFND